MIDGKKILGIIPARGGSKRLPRKNVMPLGGKPLIGWTIEAALASKFLDRVILTSEDAEIIAVAKQHGCDAPFVRPRELAQDSTSGVDPMVHAVRQLPGYDYAVLLQPTSPLRISKDIDGCIEQCVRKQENCCVSVVELSKSPRWIYTLEERSSRMLPVFDERRFQGKEKFFTLNGAVYVAKTDWLLAENTLIHESTCGYEMPVDRSIDIDTIYDFKLCEFLLAK